VLEVGEVESSAGREVHILVLNSSDTFDLVLGTCCAVHMHISFQHLHLTYGRKRSVETLFTIVLQTPKKISAIY